MAKRLDVFCDGACMQFAASSGRGGWAAVLVYKGEILRLKGAVANTTNNRMEMEAVLQALERINKEPHCVDEVVVYSDSKVTVNVFSGERKGKANTDLIARFKVLQGSLADKGTTVRLQWTKGHNGHVYNEMADQLAEAQLLMWQATRSLAGHAEQRRHHPHP
jgi:ribonuclease HI